MPLVVNAAQQHGTVELERAFGKERFVVEKIRSGLLDLQWLDPPVEAVQLQTLKAPRLTGRRIAERTALQISRCLLQRLEYRRWRQFIGPVAANRNSRDPVVAANRYVV